MHRDRPVKIPNLNEYDVVMECDLENKLLIQS
jgi:hypothetical protein